MKTTPWSLALIAGASAAWTAGPDGEWTECPDEATSAPAYPASSVPAWPVSSVPAYPVESVSSAPADPSYPAWPSSAPAPSYPVDPVPSEPAVYTNTKTIYTTVCPCETPTRTPGEVYTTYTTEYHTTLVNPQPKPYTWGQWTSTFTDYDVSTIYTSYTTTCTEPEHPAPTYPAGGEPSYPAGAPSYPAGGDPSWPSGSAPPYPVPSGSWSAGAYPTGSYSGYPSGSWPAYPTGTAYPSGWNGGYPGGPGGYGNGGHGGNGGYGHGGSGHQQCSKPKNSTGSCTRCEGQPDPEDQFCGYGLNDNWYDVVPKTCEEKVYHFTIESTTIAPDGYERPAMLVNGQMPGPLIEANWGDTITVHLYNALPTDARNGTSLHFHGLRQNGTNEYDGVSSITQCPIAPGSSMTYTFVAGSYGTSWWHAHYALQTYDGVFGPLIIHGPQDTGYDDEQVILLSDWSHRTAEDIFYERLYFDPNVIAGPVTLDNGLINGMTKGESGGEYFSMTVEAGKTYRIRLVNTAIQSTFKFQIDGHSFTVIAMDFVPIHSYETNIVSINIGQRYDLLIKADQEPGNYWIRSDNQDMCGPMVTPNTNGILHYSDAPVADPTTQGIGYEPNCMDEPYEKLVPLLEWNVGGAGTTIGEHGAVISPNGLQPNIYKWLLSGTSFQVQWQEPTLYSIWENGTIPAEYQGNLAIEVPNLGEWVYVIIDSPMPLPHPIHLHGHDFMILAQGTGPYKGNVALNLDNPPRRDVATLPADPPNGLGGYIVLAYYTSNPGVWLLHCHIGWHNSMGFALQIIENLEGIKKTVQDSCQMQELCAAWDSYAYQYDVFTQNLDAGI